MLANKTDVDIKKDLNFSISWSYDGKTIFDNQKVSYFIKDSGELPSHSATLILLPLNEEQQRIVDGMSDPSKMKLHPNNRCQKDRNAHQNVDTEEGSISSVLWQSDLVSR